MLDYTPARDLLGNTAPLDYRERFPLLGLPLEIRSNSAAVIAAAQRSFGRWSDLDPALIEPGEPLLVRIVVHPEHSSAAVPSVSPPSAGRDVWTQRVHSGCFLASNGSNVITAQMNHGQALAFVTPELVADDLSFRYHVLECLSLLLVGWRDRTPVHAGALVENGRALLLVGPSKAGKSTLCYAGLRAGFQLLAEDAVYVSLHNGLRLWGNPWSLHLLPDARHLFEELASYTPELRANGKRKLAIDVASFGADRPCRHADRAIVCLLQRDDRQPSSLQTIDPQIARDMLNSGRETGFDLFHYTDNVVAALVGGGAYRLTVGHDLDGALTLLRELAHG